MSQTLILNDTHPLDRPLHTKVCSSFFDRFRGLMLRPSLEPSDSILIDEIHQSRTGTSIHMFFMNFDIVAVWLDKDCQVVDIQIARRWRPYYAPSQPARYILEASPDRLADFHIGDRLVLQRSI